MTSTNSLEDHPEFVFIGGAGRSGTSLMYWLFDWHPEIMVFLGETPVFQKYWINPEEKREEYFRDTFLTPEEGKQARFVDPDAMAKFNQKMLKEFKGFNNPEALDINTEFFHNTYLELLNRDNMPLLRRIFEGLGKGLITGYSELSKKYGMDGTKYYLFKHPYYTELHAQKIASLLPKSKFIHIVRSPADRYISAKQLRIRQGSSLINGVDFCFAHTETWISSRVLAEKNLEALGNDMYKIVHYEKLVTNTEEEMRKLAEWLGVKFTDSLLHPTVLGSQAGSNSSFNKKGSRKNIHASNRKKEFKQLTSLSERLQFYYLLGFVRDYIDEYDIPYVSKWIIKYSRWIPFKFEERKDYLSRIKERVSDPSNMSNKKLRNMLFNRLPARAEKKIIELS